MTKTKNSFIDSFTNAASKIGSQRHLASIRDGFISLMPLIIAGSLALMIKNIPIKDWSTEILPEFIVNICNAVWWGTFGILSIFTVFSIAYHLAKSYDGNGLLSGFIALASYFSLVPQSIVGPDGEGLWGNISWSYTSANSLFVAILIALLSTEVFVRLHRTDALNIKLPPSVPPAVGRSFSALIPASLTIIFIALLGLSLESLFGQNVFALATVIFEPLVSAADSLASGIVIVLLNQILWCLGLHGSNIIGGVFEPISLDLMAKNIAAYDTGGVVPHIMTKPFLDAFVHLGGSGATLGLIIAIFITSRSKLMRTMGKTCIGPGLFNINEPVLFGIPVVLNPILFIPFILGPVLLVILSYAATAIGLVSRTVAIIPWATPPILSGWMATGGDWRACVLQVINIAIMALLYIPFIRIVDRLELKKEQEA